jgi:hypothetical protein
MLPEAGARPENTEVVDFGDDPVGTVAPSGNMGDPHTVNMGNMRATQAPQTAETALLREEMVEGLQSKGSAVATTRQLVAEERAALAPFLFMGMCFGLAAVLSVFAVLLLERESEYATLRAMGYGRSKILRVVFTEMAVLSLLGLGAAALAWLGIHAYIVAALSRALFPLPIDYRLGDFLSVAIPTVASLSVAAVLAVRGILRIDLRAALCARDIG